MSLKKVLLINALSSGATGAGLVVFGNVVANIFGVIQPQAFWAVGIFLIAFGALVFTESRQQSSRQNRVRLIIVLDTLWVIGSAVIVVLQLFNLSSIGYILISGVAAWVALMAFLQTAGLKKELSNI